MPAQENEKVIQQTQHRHHNLDDVNGSRHELCFVVVVGWLEEFMLLMLLQACETIQSAFARGSGPVEQQLALC